MTVRPPREALQSILAILVIGAMAMVGQAATVTDHRHRIQTAVGWALQGRTADALQSLRQLLGAHPRDAMVLNDLGNLYFIEGNVATARVLYDRALASDSSDAGIYVNRGHVCLAMNDSSRAIADFREAIRLAGGSRVAAHLIHLQDLPVTKAGEVSSFIVRTGGAPGKLVDREALRRHFDRLIAVGIPVRGDSTKAGGPSGNLVYLPLYWKY